MKRQLNSHTAELREELEGRCTKCPFNASKYSQCSYASETILDCYDKDWVIIRHADIFKL